MSLTPEQVEYQTRHINESRQGDTIGAGVSMAIVSILAVSLRFYAKWARRLKVSYDDWVCLAALVFALSLCVMGFISGYFGAGRHILSVSQADLVVYLKLAYAFPPCFAVAVSLVKFSILFLYRRMFPLKQMSPFWWASYWILCGGTAALALLGVFATIFSCTPVQFGWDKTIVGGRCINIALFHEFFGIYNIVLDLSVLVLPMPVVWRLQMKRSRKLCVIGLFALGTLVCVTSIFRYVAVKRTRFDAPVDPTCMPHVPCQSRPVAITPFFSYSYISYQNPF